MSQPFRFLHASDFHLERPLAGLAETPAHLAELMIDAPYAAAERVFAAAVTERVEFVVLAGDIVHVDRAGPRSVAFLIDQFQRLAAKNIAVYWAGGTAERRGPWPDGLRLPENVHVFAHGAPQALTHIADGDALAVLVGRSATKATEKNALESLLKPKGSLFAIGVAHTADRTGRVGKSNLDYWACGGAHRRRRIAGKQTLYFSGSPQGRAPMDRGRHGALLVAIDEQAGVQTRFIATDVARFERLPVRIDPTAPASEQQRLMAEKVEAVRARAAGVDLFLRVQIVPTRALPMNQSRESWSAEWLRWLRQEFGTDSPAAWTVSVAVAARKAQVPAEPPAGSLLAEFLASIHEIRRDTSDLPLLASLDASQQDSPLAAMLRVDDAHQRRRVLRLAEGLARDLLAGEAPA